MTLDARTQGRAPVVEDNWQKSSKVSETFEDYRGSAHKSYLVRFHSPIDI